MQTEPWEKIPTDMQGPNLKDKRDRTREQATAHVEWLLEFMYPIIKQFAIHEFIHGYKHGKEDSNK